MYKVKNYKRCKWQDVPLVECFRHHDIPLKEDEDISKRWDIAAIKNAIAFGDIPGGGLDVRCGNMENKEIVSVFIDFTDILDIKGVLRTLGWTIETEKRFNVTFRKNDTLASFDVDETNIAAYVETTYSPNKFIDDFNDSNAAINVSFFLQDKLKQYGIHPEKIQKLANAIEYNKHSIDEYLHAAKHNYVILHYENGELKPNSFGDGEICIYGDFEGALASFNPLEKEFIITEYQYWFNLY